jgi:lipopolysaccharide exporter
LFIGKISEDCIHLFGIIQNDKDIFKKGINKSNLVAQMKKYKKFPKFSLWASLINTFSWQVPTLFLALFFNTTIVGFYMMGDRVIRMPINVIGRAIAQVFFQKGAEAHREGKIDLIFLQTVKMLSQIGFIPLLVLTFVGKELFIVLLGQKWAEAGVYVQIMAPWAFILFLAFPLSNIINISEKQEKGLLFNVFILTSRIAALIIGGIADSPRLALAIFSFSGVLCYGWLLLWTGEVAQVPWQKTLRAVFSSDIRWSLSTVMILTILKFLPVSVWGLSFASALIVLLYFFLLWKRISVI